VKPGHLFLASFVLAHGVVHRFARKEPLRLRLSAPNQSVHVGMREQSREGGSRDRSRGRRRSFRSWLPRASPVVLSIATALASGAARAQHTAMSALAIDAGGLAEIGTYWLHSDFLARPSQSTPGDGAIGIGHLTEASHCLQPRLLLTHLVTSLRSWVRTAILAGERLEVVSPPAATADLSAGGRFPVSTNSEGMPANAETLSLLRLEIKGRLPYVQACVEAGRRRGGVTVRRLQVTWSIGADGNIRQFKLEGAPDPWLAGCITRSCRRPFAAKPGVEIVVPAPILFLR
jgi:hypothetical protein